MKIKFVKLHPEASLPEKGTEGAAAFDLRACIEYPVTVHPGETVKIPTGLKMETPIGFASLLFPRSGLALKHGITLANCVGVVDSDYRGEIGIALVNQKPEPFTIHPNDRVAQLALVPVVDFEPVETDELSDTERAEGGFGHTGLR